MSDHELRTDTLDAGHRKVTKKSTKIAKADEKPDKAGSEKKATKRPKSPGRGAGLRKAGSAMTRPFGFLRKGFAVGWRVWDRAYDDAMARPVRAVKVFGIVVASMVVLGGLCWAGSYHYSSLNAARGEAAQEGQAAVTQLLSYNWRSLDRQVEKTQDLVTGRFKDDYAQFVNKTIAPTARDKQVSSQTSVDRSAIVSSSSNEIVMLMFLDQESGSQLNPSSDASMASVRVTLQKEDGKWKVSELTPV